MLPDVIERDEYITGERREGIYFGFFTIFLKLAVTGGLAITNFILAMSGFQADVAQCGGLVDHYYVNMTNTTDNSLYATRVDDLPRSDGTFSDDIDREIWVSEEGTSYDVFIMQ